MAFTPILEIWSTCSWLRTAANKATLLRVSSSRDRISATMEPPLYICYFLHGIFSLSHVHVASSSGDENILRHGFGSKKLKVGGVDNCDVF
jgi:hypothetical protein